MLYFKRVFAKPISFFLGALAIWIGFSQQNSSVLSQAVAQSGVEVDWPSYGLNDSETHYSPLKQIDPSNIRRLGLAWTADAKSYAGQIEGTPLLVNGTLYGTLPWSVAVAIDARTGKEKWRWDPQIPHETFVTDARGVKYRRGPSMCCGPVNRGVAYHRGKVFLGTLDNRLVALDAETGKQVWSTAVASREDDYTITGAPRIIKGNIIIGNGGAEFGVRGFVAAYNPDSGKQVWRFWIVPGDPTLPFENKAMEAASKTWNGPYWKYGGGGTAWDGMAYDSDLDLLYIGTGNGSPWPRDLRSPGGGDNLYLACILALRPETGEYVWHFQETPKDSWDYASTPPLVLADLIVDGRPRKVILHAPKNGFFYVVDRVTGEFISGKPFTKVTWATGVDSKTGRPIETPEAAYGAEGSTISPGSDGAHNWHAMAWNPIAGLVYIPGQETSGVYSFDPDFQHQIGRMNTGRRRAQRAARQAVERGIGPEAVGAGGAQQHGAYLVAWDPVAQKERWRIRFERPGVTGGTVATASNLLFHGSNDGTFNAYTADKGEKLWSVQLAPGFANPITYILEGKQYITVFTGRGGTQAAIGRAYAFALDAHEPIPSMSPAPNPEEMTAIDATVAAEFDRAALPDAPGRKLIQELCAGCHSPTVVTRFNQSEGAWRETVNDMGNRGMAGTPEQREVIVKYLAAHLGPGSVPCCK
jgi:quinohemoprotein ethanol dehydrogenase